MSTVNVSANAMNLAGPLEDRPNVLKTAMISRVINPPNEDLADMLQRTYANGPGARMRSMIRWAQDEDNDNYNYIGKTQSFFNIGPDPDDYDNPDMRNHRILTDEQESLVVRTLYPTSIPNCDASNIESLYRNTGAYQFRIETGPATYTYWANARYFTDHFDAFPEASKPWKASYNAGTNQITLNAPGRFTDTFTPSDYDADERYIYATVSFGLATRFLIYRIGSGNTDLDALEPYIKARDSGFHPFVPIRVNNIMVNESCPEAYEQARIALKKVNGINIDEITDKLAEHDDIADMDGAHVMFGVQVNTLEKAGKKYIYEFYRWLADAQFKFDSDRTTYRAAQNTHDASVLAKVAWIEAGSVGSPPSISTAPTTGRGQMTTTTYGAVPGGPSANFSVSVLWRYLREEWGTGIKDVAHPVGDLWWEVIYGADGQSEVSFAGGNVYPNGKYGTECRMHWQVTPNLWKTMVIGGGLFYNNVFGGSFKQTKLGVEAVADGESLFALPLNKVVLSRLGMVDATQVCTQSYILVVGAFKVITKSLLGAIIMFIAITLMILFPPLNVGAGLALSTGVLGLAGAGAAIIGAIVNTIVAMIITKIVTKIATLVLGAKIGQIIGAVLSFVTFNIANGLASGMNLSSIFSGLLRVDNLIMLTNSVGSGISGYLSAAVQEVYQDIKGVTDKYNSGMKTLQDLYASNIGYGMGSIDPMELTESPFGIAMETSSQFLERTLITGTDIAELSKDLLNNFTTLTTDVTLPLGQA